MSLLALMAYYCYCIEYKLSDVNKHFISLVKFKQLSRKIIEIHCSVKQFDRYINVYLFVIIMFSSISCMSNCVIFYYDKGVKHSDSLPTIIESVAMIYIICFNSEKITKAYGKILDKIETT